MFFWPLYLSQMLSSIVSWALPLPGDWSPKESTDAAFDLSSPCADSRCRLTLTAQRSHNALLLPGADSKQRKADLKTRASKGWKWDLVMRSSLCPFIRIPITSSVFFLVSQVWTRDHQVGLSLLSLHKPGHSIQPWPWSATCQLIQRQGVLTHQGASLAQELLYFPWLPVPWWRSPWRVGLDPRRGRRHSGAGRQ